MYLELTLKNLIPVFAVALVVALLMTPVSIRIAHKIGAIDVPKDDRRMHHRAIPRFGGFAIYLGTMVTLAAFEWHDPKIRVAMLGGTLMYLLGVWDDLKTLKSWQKLIGQIAIAFIMYAMGMRIDLITNYFGQGHLQLNAAMTFLITMLWLVGITNTINLIDGLDGLAAGVSAIAALSIAYVAYIHGAKLGMPGVCLAMVAIAGSCIGFLPFNFSPAKTFMGDSGALFLGFMIAILSVVGPLKRSTFIAVAVPVVVLAIPIFDTSFAMIRRLVNHRPIMEADKNHLHHKLIASGYGQRRAVIMLYGICAIAGMAAVLISRELYKDAFVLGMIAVAYLYVFLTDPAHKMPQIRAVNIADEEKKAERQAKQAQGSSPDGETRPEAPAAEDAAAQPEE